MVDFLGQDVLSTKSLSKSEIEKVMTTAEGFLPYANKEKTTEILKGKLMASLFYEPSTRTKLSFESAMQRLGGRVVSVVGIESSSLAKGETLSDTAKVVETYADVIAVRHSQPGAPREMADAVDIPVLNAGDGAGEHPTQALLDLFTIQNERGKIDGLTIALVGDLKYGRTVHSLAYLLAHYDVNLILVSPDQLKMPAEVTNDLAEKGVVFSETEDFEESLKQADVCYMTRIQKERFADPAEYDRFKDVYILTKELVEQSNPEMTIMHPLPRVGEISLNVDELPGAAYFRQMRNGVAVRMALLSLVLGASL
ncbi:MAG: aspartate carbamoyltransferase [Candidatus Gracilibacteria bacterium]